MILLLFACTRDVMIGVENLPEDAQFELYLDGKQGQKTEDNIWLFRDISAPANENLRFFYGKKECQLSNSSVLVERGFGEVRWKTDWSCPQLMGYDVIQLKEEKLAVGKSEITTGFWQKIMGGEKEDPCGVDCPQAGMSWDTALLFANKLSMMEGLEQCYRIQKSDQEDQEESITVKPDCDGWRLPTDKEWDRFSQIDRGLKYAGSNDATKVGWVRSNSDMTVHPVCTRQRNQAGICDLTGNVWEWCFDSAERNPSLKRVRGGGFSSREEVALLQNKIDFPQRFGAAHIGFRLVRSISEN